MSYIGSRPTSDGSFTAWALSVERSPMPIQYQLSEVCVQTNLCRTATLGTWKTWLLGKGLYEKGQWKVSFSLVVLSSDWLLLRGGRYSGVVVRTDLTVL